MKIKKRCKMNEALENISEIDGIYGQVDLTTAQAKKDSEKLKDKYSKIEADREKEMKEFQAMNDRREIPNIKRTNKFELDESLFEDCGKQKRKTKKINESASEVFNHKYYDLVEKELAHTDDLDMIELVLNTLDRIDDYSSETDQFEAIDSALIYDDDIWTIMHYFFKSNPRHVNYEQSIEYFTDVIISICNQIANKLPKDESLTEERHFEYKKKREPLADIIQMELTNGEIGYLVDETGKKIPTPGPHADYKDSDIGVNDDEGKYFIQVYGNDEADLEKAKDIAIKYKKEYEIKPVIGVPGKKALIKIYIDEKDFDESIKTEAIDNSEDLSDEELDEILDFNIGSGTQNNSSDVKLDIPFIPGV